MAVEAASDSSANPTAYRAAPTTITHRGPMRSAIIPASGNPNMMFCTAIDRLNVSRPVARVAVIGCRNSPNDCRAPIAIATVRAPWSLLRARRRAARDRQELEAIAAHADELNREAHDVLEYQDSP